MELLFKTNPCLPSYSVKIVIPLSLVWVMCQHVTDLLICSELTSPRCSVQENEEIVDLTGALLGPQTGCVKWLALESKERFKVENTHRYCASSQFSTYCN